MKGRKAWKRCLVSLLVAGMLANSMPIIPARAQESDPQTVQTRAAQGTSKEDALEVSVGGEIKGLVGIGSDAYKMDETGGYWIKVTFPEAGTYVLQKGTEGYLRCEDEKGNLNFGSGSQKKCRLTVTEAGTMYFYVKGMEDFTVSLTKTSPIKKIEATPASMQAIEGIYSLGLWHAASSLLLTLEDGTTETVDTLYLNIAEYDLRQQILDKDGNYVSWPDMGYFPAGEYQYVLETATDSSVNVKIPFAVVDKDTLAQELVVGGTVTGLSGTEGYEQTVFASDGHWFKAEITQAGSYRLEKTADGYFCYLDNRDNYWTWNRTKSLTQYCTPGTYYFYAAGKETFDLKLSRIPRVTEIRVEEQERVNIYREMCGNDISLGKVITKIYVTLDDGTEDEVALWDSAKWNQYQISCELLDESGKTAALDAEGLYPAGTYRFSIYERDSRVGTSVTFQVQSAAEKAQEIRVGQTVTGLKSTNTWDWSNYEYTDDGHWFKATLKPGRYLVSVADARNSYIAVSRRESSADYTMGSSFVGITAPEEGTYYIYVRGEQGDFSVTLENGPVVTDVKALTEVCYSTRWAMEVELTLEGGEKVIVNSGERECERYGLVMMITDEDGRMVFQPYPIGKAYCEISCRGTDVRVKAPITIADVDSAAKELKVGQTMENLSGTERYQSPGFVNGHWLKVDFAETGNYVLKMDTDGYQCLTHDFSATSFTYNESFGREKILDITETGTYYIYVKGKDTFSVSLEKAAGIVEIRAEARTDAFYLETTKFNLNELGLEWVYFRLSDGSVIEQYIWDGLEEVTLTNGDRMYYQLLDSEGKKAVPDANGKYAVGSYYARLSIDGTSVKLDIPVKVVSIDSMAKTLVPGGKLTGLTAAENPYDFDYQGGHWLKITVTEPGDYMIQKTAYGYLDIKKMYSTAKAGILAADKAGDYYVYVKGAETFDVTLKKVPVLKKMELKEIKRDKHLYKLDEGPRILIRSLLLTFEDGSTKETSPWDEVWNTYNIYYNTLNPDDSWPISDESGRFPVGKYQMWLRVASHEEVECKIPFEVVPNTGVENLKIGATKEVKELTDGYVQMELKKGLYRINYQSQGMDECLFMLHREDGQALIEHTVTPDEQGEAVQIISVDEDGVYYLHYSDIPKNYSFHVSEVGEISDIELLMLNWSGDVMVMNMECSFVAPCFNLVEGDSKSQMWYEDSVWWSLGMSMRVVDTATGQELKVKEGNWGIEIEKPGTYRIEYKSEKLGISREVEFEAKTTEELPELRMDQTLAAPKHCMRAYYKLIVTQKSTYRFTSNMEFENSDIFMDSTIYTPEGDFVWGANFTNTYADNLVTLEPGTYCVDIYAFGMPEDARFTATRIQDQTKQETEEKLESAVTEVVDAAENLKDQSIVQASTEVKVQAVEEVLETVKDVYEKQQIGTIGTASADAAIELAQQLTEVEEQISKLLNTSVTVETQEEEVQAIQPKVKNALLSVPAGEEAQIEVSAAEVPKVDTIKQDGAVAIKMELKSKEEGKEDVKMQLSAPVVVTVNIPKGIKTDEKIVVYHFHAGNSNYAEKISARVNPDGTLSFVTGSFSTFVIANEQTGKGSITGSVVSGMSKAKSGASLELLTEDGKHVAQTTPDADQNYKLDDIPYGNYILRVSQAGHVTRDYLIDVEKVDVVVNAVICLRGDVDMNGTVDIGDHQRLFTYLQGTGPISEAYQLKLADVDGKSGIDIGDHQRLFTHLQGTNLLD